MAAHFSRVEGVQLTAHFSLAGSVFFATQFSLAERGCLWQRIFRALGDGAFGSTFFLARRAVSYTLPRFVVLEYA